MGRYGQLFALMIVPIREPSLMISLLSEKSTEFPFMWRKIENRLHRCLICMELPMHLFMVGTK